MTTVNKQLPEDITEEMVAKAKEKHGEKNVKLADLPKDDDGDEFLTVLICRPARNVVHEFSKWADRNPGKAEEILVNACLLSHKDIVKADDGLMMGAFSAISQLISLRKGIVKNL